CPLTSGPESESAQEFGRYRATYDDMARAVGVSSATVRRDAEILIGRGLLKRVGSRKAGHWEVRGEKNHDIR
ncbi:DeoR family transcriptional regulator, partial [Bifidobacterium bifidum]|uniref:DeoR family transcriptional regulator n=1 Tax=Bifidobacterium bifidum TaxID=1681 RepID=UPI003B9ACE75